MKIYVFESIEKLTNRWHSGGGAVVVAKSKKRAKELIESCWKATKVTDEEYQKALVYPTKATAKERVFIFPDAGCC